MKKIKCVIWDLDNTLWDGVLSEGGGSELRPGVRQVIEALDARGIIQSVASKNDAAPALRKLEEFGLTDYFLCPQINWGAKSQSIETIAQKLNLKYEAMAFVDDNPYERDEVTFALPRVSTYDAADSGSLPDLPEFQVRFITEDAKNRRRMYQADLRRTEAEEAFPGGNDAFLSTLNMRMTLSPVIEADLQRVEELTVRTHQLNSTGYTYSYEELLALTKSDDHIFLICGLDDVYGTSGKVGLLLLEKSEVLTIKLLIVSCRVMSRGIGSALLSAATQIAHKLGLPLQADFLETEHNRIMYITYKLAGFEELAGEEESDALTLEYAEEEPRPFPPYLTVIQNEV